MVKFLEKMKFGWLGIMIRLLFLLKLMFVLEMFG